MPDHWNTFPVIVPLHRARFVTGIQPKPARYPEPDAEDTRPGGYVRPDVICALYERAGKPLIALFMEEISPLPALQALRNLTVVESKGNHENDSVWLAVCNV